MTQVNSTSTNGTLDVYLKDNFITQVEYDLLIEPKNQENSWFNIIDGNQNWTISKEKQDNFYLIITKILDDIKSKHNHNSDKLFDLSFIHFPNLNFKYLKSIFNTKDSMVSFWKAVFYGKSYFIDIQFECKIVFEECTFNNEITFKKSTFNSIVNFKNVTFKEMANFRGVSFDEWVSFNNITVYKTLDFTYSRTNDFIDFSDSKINNIDLEHSRFDSIGFLHIKGLDKNKNEIPLTKKHFANKESARLIKAHFEKQGNITEANKYFVIEQEKYIEELKDKANVTEGGKRTKLLPLRLNKYISNFGTDWVRATAVLFIFAVVSNLIYGLFNDKLVSIFPLTSLNWIENIKDYLNTLVKMVNPLNAFKAKDNIFEDYEFFGAIVRIGSAAIIYQIIIAFRQFTRRA